MSNEKRRTWFITGVSSGLGQALAEKLLETGACVIGTFRNEVARAAFEAQAPGQSIGLLLDVTDEAEVHSSVLNAVTRTGGIDVLVNNAGFGLEGAIEEVTLDQVRQQFEVNVFGPIALIQAVLPYMRKRRTGHIVNITSMAGLTAFPSLGIYNASKYALEGLSEALAKEAAHLGIRVTIIEPGGVRTDWAGRSMVHASKTIDDYAQSAGVYRDGLAQRNGQQIGDPQKVAAAIITAVYSEEPPLHLLLGHDALHYVGQKLGALQAEIMKWAPLSSSTNF